MSYAVVWQHMLPHHCIVHLLVNIKHLYQDARCKDKENHYSIQKLCTYFIKHYKLIRNSNTYWYVEDYLFQCESQKLQAFQNQEPSA